MGGSWWIHAAGFREQSLEYLTPCKPKRSIPRGQGQRAVQFLPDHDMGIEVLAAVGNLDLQSEVQTGDHLSLRLHDINQPEWFSSSLSLRLDGKSRCLPHLGVDFYRGVSSGDRVLIGFRGFVVSESSGSESQSEGGNAEETVHVRESI